MKRSSGLHRSGGALCVGRLGVWVRQLGSVAGMVLALLCGLQGMARAEGQVAAIPVPPMQTVEFDASREVFGPQTVANCVESVVMFAHGTTCVGIYRYLPAGVNDGAYCGSNHGDGICYNVVCKDCRDLPFGWGTAGWWTYTFREGHAYSCPANASGFIESPTCTCNDDYTADSTATRCVPTVEVPWASAPPPPECEVCKGNPIYPLRGVKHEVLDTGLAIGRTTLQFSYDNGSMIPKLPAALAGVSGKQQRGGVLGSSLWFSNLHRRVSLGADRSSAGSSTLPMPTVFDRGTGVAKTMTRIGSGELSAEPGNADRFIPLAGGGYIYTDSASNVQETYTNTGQLTAMAWADRTRISFTYDSTGLLTQASDNRGRSLSFTYVDPGAGLARRLSTITDAGGQVTTLTHDSQNNLTGITWRDGKSRSFLYENTALPWALTGVGDERGIRYATFGYDAQGRAISTEHAGGVERYAVSYTTPPSIRVTEQGDANGKVRFQDWNLPTGTVMTEPSGQTTTWSAISVNGKNLFSAQGQQGGAGSLASSRSQSYDANGNIASRDNFNGTRTCYVNDLARNLVITSVVGLTTQDCSAVTPANASLPAGATKTSTQWHPDWSLPTKVAAPKQITTYVYNGQPDPFAGNATISCAPGTASLLDGKPAASLCKRVVQQTADVDGHLGFNATPQAGATVIVTTWTYNEDGQVLTVTDADSGTTTYVYYTDTTATHTRGDLQSITTSLGKVTTFNEYNKLGQVLQSTDPRGVVTVNTYDLRQRLLTTTVNGLTTTYTWDAAGQLTRVTEPDGTWVGFEYDDAHRRIAATDDDGNRIDYVLDNAGNQTAERAKDPTGSLKRTVARLMDALGRAQQGTGRE